MPEPLLTRYLQPLLAGRRAECFQLIRQAVEEGWMPDSLINEVLWPSMSQIERLYQDDRINVALEHMASRINRTVADQLQASMPQKDKNGKRIIIACADGFREEVGAQIVADLFQSDGWDVFFVGGGVPDDELLTMVGQVRPDCLLVFGADPQQVPLIRRLIELIREIGVCPRMNIILSGGVFNRAEGLWEEIGADGFAEQIGDVVEYVSAMAPREPGPPRRGTIKKRIRRRRSKENQTMTISKEELGELADEAKRMPAPKL